MTNSSTLSTLVNHLAKLDPLLTRSTSFSLVFIFLHKLVVSIHSRVAVCLLDDKQLYTL